ncbi:MAG TPA: mandelate racemase/muconate lactonizing enzyme family protein [Armatimonadota bacterium]|nr:mandelate racemase/muconate lactonizing enzyme family protein [Armatimonadota bacterium]
MQVTDVRCRLVHCPIPPDQRSHTAAGLRLARQTAIVEVDTDEGITGIGSVPSPYDLRVTREIIENVLAPSLAGADPFATEYIWHMLYETEVSRTLGTRGIGVAALSAIDIALWDIKGKALNVPVYALLGGAVAERFRVYASAIPWTQSPEQAVEEAELQVHQGYSALKLKFGGDLQRDFETLEAVRYAVGDDVELMVDAEMTYPPNIAIRVARVLEEMDVFWFEEPMVVDDLDAYRRLASATDVRLALGRSLSTRHQFKDFVLNDAVQALQADVARAGGFTEVRKIVDMASCFNLMWSPHTIGDIITTVANLHLAATCLHTPFLEFDVTYNPLMTNLLRSPIRQEEGVIYIPDGPGLGIEIDDTFIDGFPYQGEPAIGPVTRMQD